jgi:hypothetical protein
LSHRAGHCAKVAEPNQITADGRRARRRAEALGELIGELMAIVAPQKPSSSIA